MNAAIHHYTFLRALEAEGRHPQEVGCWATTLERVWFGEGFPDPYDPAIGYLEKISAPYPPTPKLPPDRLTSRSGFYRRIRTAGECALHARPTSPLRVSLTLSTGWARPVEGLIPLPASGDELLDDTHAVSLVGHDAGRQLFLFQNSWGEKWGMNGFGILPQEYIERYMFESWSNGIQPRVEFSRSYRAGDHVEFCWKITDPGLSDVFGFEITSGTAEGRRGWAMAVETDGALEVEDLYVRPTWRGRGYANRLITRVQELAAAKRLPVRLWVPFSDCASENPENRDAVVAIARRLGVRFQPCPVPWAAYFATNEEEGSESPIEPPRIPQRPRSTLEAVLTVALGLSSAVDSVPPFPASPPDPAVATSSHSPGENLIDVTSPAWVELNQRRAHLIRKKNGGEPLSPEESEELDRLQKVSRESLKRSFPAPTRDREEINRLRELLLNGGGAVQ